MKTHHDHLSTVTSRITVLFLKYIFIPFGIFVEPSQKKYERIYTFGFLFVFFTLFIGQVKQYESLNSLLFVLDNTMYVIATLVATVFLFTAVRGKHTFERFYYNVISYEYGSEEFFEETDTRFKNLAIYLGPVIAISFIGVIVYPILNAACTDVSLGSPSTLIYLSYYPWKVDTVPKYIGTIVLQLCSGSVVCSVVGCMIFFILYCVVVLEAHCNILDRKIKGIDKKVKFLENHNMVDSILHDCHGKSKDQAFDELNAVVKYHQFLNKFTEDIIACCTRIVDTSTAAVFSCTVLLITMFLLSRGHYMYQLKVLSMSIVTFCLFIIQCYIGENLYHVNVRLLLEVYNVKWYEQPIRFRKLMLIFMTRCQQSYQIRAFNTLEVNYLFFTKVLKNIYSVLQFILRMKTEQTM